MRVRAMQGALPSIPAGIGLFDCVVLSHVLEHIWELGPAMAAIRKSFEWTPRTI